MKYKQIIMKWSNAFGLIMILSQYWAIWRLP